MKRSLVPLAVVALLLLSGCGALSGNGNPAGDPPGADRAGTGTVAPEALPPGVAQTGVENASALVDAHVGALAATGFEHTFTSNYTIRTDGGARHVNATKRAAGAANLAEYRVIERRDVPIGGRIVGVRSALWGNESVAVLRLTRMNRTAYRRVPVDSPSFDVTRYATFANTLVGYLQLGNYTVAGAERRDGETLVTLRATGVSPRANAASIDARNVSSYEGRVVVNSRGVIQSLHAELSVDAQSNNATVRADYRLEATGDVAVERPPWVPSVLNRTANR